MGGLLARRSQDDHQFCSNLDETQRRSRLHMPVAYIERCTGFIGLNAWG
jgi:hypothetical protein